MDSSRAKTPSNRLSDCTAQGLCRPIRKPQNITSLWCAKTPPALLYYGTFLFKLTSPYNSFNTDSIMEQFGLNDEELHYLYVDATAPFWHWELPKLQHLA